MLENKGTPTFPGYLRAQSVKGTNELATLARDPAALRNFLNREETMLKTGQNALGGSQTAENLADIANSPGGMEAFGIGADLARGQH
jgi:hypothetical protein